MDINIPELIKLSDLLRLTEEDPLKYREELYRQASKCSNVSEEDLAKPGIKRKCKITRYDDTITSPPYLRIFLEDVEIEEPEESDEYGEIFAERIRRACKSKGYTFKSYSLSPDDAYDFELIVWGEGEY